MADKGKEKPKGGEKKERRPSSSSSSGHSTEDSGGSNVLVDSIFWILLVLVAYSVLKGMLSAYGISFGLPSATGFFEFVFEKVQIYSVFLSLIFFIGIIYFNFKIGELAHQDHHRIHGHSHGGHVAHSSEKNHAPAVSAAPQLPKAFKDTHSPVKRWEMVMTRLNSFSEGDWRLSIIEADIVLNEMLSKMGLEGDGVAARLKHADKSSFNTLDIAWEAHKFRNRIAHEGASFQLTHDEAKRAIEQYKQVFDEFYFV